MSSNVGYSATTWQLSERFGPRISPVQWLEINPTVSFKYVTSNYTLSSLSNRSLNVIALNIDGEVEFLKTFKFTYNANKNYVSGVNANVTNNPLIINATFEKDLFKKRIGTLRLQVFDLLNQNNFISRSFTDNSIVDTRTNTVSRYAMLGFRVNLQKWNGTPSKNGQPLKRRGDGSFY